MFRLLGLLMLLGIIFIMIQVWKLARRKNRIEAKGGLPMLSFFKNYGKKKVSDSGQSLTALLTKFDPESASDAQIAELESTLDVVTSQMVKAREEYKKEQKEAEQAEKVYNQKMDAAEILQQKIGQTEGDDKAALEGSLAKLLDDVEAMVPEVEREKIEAADALEFLTELETSVDIAATNLKSAKSKFTQLQRDMKRADVKKQRAKDKEDNAKVLAGIKKQASGLGTVFDSMQREVDRAERKVQEHEVKIEKLKGTKVEEDPNIAEALKVASGQETKSDMSLSDRLASLKR